MQDQRTATGATICKFRPRPMGTPFCWETLPSCTRVNVGQSITLREASSQKGPADALSDGGVFRFDPQGSIVLPV